MNSKGLARQFSVGCSGDLGRICLGRSVQPDRSKNLEPDAPGQFVPGTEHPHEVFGRNPFDRAPIPGIEWNFQQGGEQQRIEELFGELTLAEPEISFAVRHQRQRVDEDRPGSEELNVVGGGIRQRKAMLQRKQVQIEMKKRRSLQQLKRPLVGIGNEADRLVLQNMRRNRSQRRLGGRIGRHQPPSRDKLGQQARGLQPFERPESMLVQDPENPAVVMRNITGGIAKRPLVTDDGHQFSTL